MPTLDFTEAAHRVRMSVKLLKWFSSYSVLGRKLVFTNGAIDEADLLAFDGHLWGPWPNRNVPTGVSEELQREAMGRCTVCLQGGAVLEEAHLQRKTKELLHYSQHPHNLTLVCPNCHARYDRGDSMLTPDVLHTAKMAAQQRHMEGVDRDVARARATAAFYEQLRAIGRSEQMPGLVTGVNTTVPPLPELPPKVAAEFPVTAATIESLRGGPASNGSVWDRIDPDSSTPWMCLHGDDVSLVDYAQCPKCDHEDFRKNYETPSFAEFADDGAEVVAYFGDEDESTPTCQNCGHSPLHYTFVGLCSYHEHSHDRDDD